MIHNIEDLAPHFAPLVTLTETGFLTMRCSSPHRHDTIYAKTDPDRKRDWNVQHCAMAIIRDWDCDWLATGEQDEFFTQCQEMYDNWDFNLMEPLLIESANPGGREIQLVNGHHRSLVLATLLLKNKVEWQPIRAFDLSYMQFDLNKVPDIPIVFNNPSFFNIQIGKEYRGMAANSSLDAVVYRLYETDRAFYERKFQESIALLSKAQDYPNPIREETKQIHFEGKLINKVFYHDIALSPNCVEDAVAVTCNVFQHTTHGSEGRKPVGIEIFVVVPPPYFLTL